MVKVAYFHLQNDGSFITCINVIISYSYLVLFRSAGLFQIKQCPVSN